MRFSVFLLSQGLAEGATPRSAFANVLAEAKLADRLGFDTVWIAEHHFTNYGFCASPLSMAIKIAAETERVRVGTAVLVLPLYDPIRLAEDIGMADVLTDGRLELGIGRGYQAEEFRKMGVALEESRARFEESAEILRRAWSGRDFTFAGEHYRIDTPLTLWPQPVQLPHPPLTVAASSNSSLKWAAEQGYAAFNSGYFVKDDLLGESVDFYHAQLAAAGHPTEGAEFKSLRFMNLTEDDSVDREAFDSSRWSARVSGSFMKGTGSVVDGYVGDVPPSESDPSDDEWLERLIFGDADRVLEKVRQFEAIGITEVCCWFSFGSLGPDKVRRSMELFAEGVIAPMRAASGTAR